MPSFDILTGFIIACVVFAFLPGPAILYIAAQTIARGQRAGLKATLGIHLGGYVHVIAAGLGLSIVFHTIPFIYVSLKWIGAVYLIYIGIRMLYETLNISHVDQKYTKSQPSERKVFIQSVIVEVLNPKTALFFIAFLPQFTQVDASLPIGLQFLVLGSILNIISSGGDLICVYMANKVSTGTQKSLVFQRVAQSTGGVILIGLGVNMAARQN